MARLWFQIFVLGQEALGFRLGFASLNLGPVRAQSSAFQNQNPRQNG